MNPKIIFLLPVLLLCNTIYSQQYAVSAIPDSLLKNSNAVKRMEQLEVTLSENGTLTTTHKYAITIFNEAADKYSWYHNFYSKLRDLKKIDGALYDANGKKLKEVKRKDIIDVPGSDGFSLMLDDRVKAHNFFYKQYPYTVEFSDEVETRNYINLAAWEPVEGLQMAVQQSSFVVIAPAAIKLRFKALNLKESPIVSTTVHQWNLLNFRSINNVDFLPDFSSIIPSVHVSAENFKYDDYTGSLDSWLNYGKFQIDLNKGRDILPEAIKKTVHQLTDNITDEKQKIKILYEYLQHNTRYISIQLGIGGLQPFDAKFVSEKKYGDCKALSNYMVALLKEADINSYYSIIHAGDNEQFYMPDFVSDQTNHIIVCVPQKNDTTWLECTDQDKAMGYMGSFTDNRYALLIKEDGGHLVKTPRYTAENNRIGSKIISKLNIDGTINAKIHSIYKGLEQEEMFNFYHHTTKEEFDKIMNIVYDLPTYKVLDSKIVEVKDAIPSFECDMDIEVANYASISGKRIFIKPNLLKKSYKKIDTSTVRIFDIEYPYSFQHEDTVVIQIPSGYRPEAMPKNISEKNKFGEYRINYAVSDSTIQVQRFYMREEGIFPPSDLKPLAAFYDLVFKADRSQAVLVKKE